MPQIFKINAFTRSPFTGNPATIIISDKLPDDASCKQLALELSDGLITFVKPLKQNTFAIRWYTPVSELKLCGHGSLSAAHVLYETHKVAIDQTIVFESPYSTFNVSMHENYIGIELAIVHPVENHLSHAIAAAFEFDIVNFANTEDSLILELADEDTLRQYNPDFSAIAALPYEAVILTSQGVQPYDFVSRVFAPRVGIPEDPVTGSAHCKLISYWHKRLGKVKLFAYQASPRGGEMHLEMQADSVLILGNALTLMQGELFNLNL